MAHPALFFHEITYLSNKSLFFHKIECVYLTLPTHGYGRRAFPGYKPGIFAKSLRPMNFVYFTFCLLFIPYWKNLPSSRNIALGQKRFVVSQPKRLDCLKNKEKQVDNIKKYGICCPGQLD